MTNYNPDAKASKSARTIRLRNAHQAMCSFARMTQRSNPNFKLAHANALQAIKAIERCCYHAGIDVREVTAKSA